MGLVLVWLTVICSAFTLVHGRQLISQEQSRILQYLSIELHQRQLADRQQVVQLTEAVGAAARLALPDGRVAELQRLMNGQPLGYITLNLNAARTVSTDLVWPGGQEGLNLTGIGITAGLWDEGGVLATHQEFGSRAILEDNPVTTSNHATHVAGTMIASGIVLEAQGMAGEASLRSYDWNTDGAEMAAAAADGLILSNHSYSYIVGWQWDYPNDGWNWWGNTNVNTIEDYLFGFYDTTAYDWDQIACAAPYYMIVAAAGNDRDNIGPEPGTEHWAWNGSWWALSSEMRLPDGDYDCLPGGPQVAKNVLVVGAVADIPEGYSEQGDVVMTSFSSWGPTDDGRIKPDLVANGLQVYSTSSVDDAAYCYSSGTSMAAPNVAGSMALLQQHYSQTHNDELPLAATLRALVIQTADEVGITPGPDYSYGWGLLNTAAATDVISCDAEEQWIIQERTLNEDQTFSFKTSSDGIDPLKVTIAWTDPPATPLSPAVNDTTVRLTNDLDLQLNHDDNEIFYPWVLNGLSPELAATQADNHVDNVEQILIPLPEPGQYTISVSHKGTLLAGKQDFSMVVTGITPSVLPSVLVWEGDSAGTDYSGVFIRDELQNGSNVDVTYTTTFPASLAGYDAVFLSFGPPPGSQPKGTFFNNTMAEAVTTYLEEGGRLYLEGGDALGIDQAHNYNLLTLLGIESAFDGDDLPNPINGLEGQSAAITNEMSFPYSSQTNTAYIDTFTIGTGEVAFIESDYGTVAIQNTGEHGQRTFVISYSLADLFDGDHPSTRINLLTAILDFILEEPPPPPNYPPQITSAAAATATEDELFVYHATATDPDGDIISYLFENRSEWLTITGGDSVAGIPDDGTTSGSFRVIASDGQSHDSLTVIITVDPVNDPPNFISALPDISFWEDSILSLPLSLWFQAVEDQETHDSLLIWSVIENAAVTATLTADSVFFSAHPDWHGVDTLLIIASDGSMADTTSIAITVYPVNDAPDSFLIFTPANDTTLTIMSENLSDTLILHWQSAEDIDGDPVWYQLDITGTLSEIIFSNDTSATSLKLAFSDLASLIDEIGVSMITGILTILATDGIDTTWAENGPFELILDISQLGTNSLGNIPGEFTLWQNYPNPFNPSTTITFATPQAAAVRLEIVDLSGRIVIQLVAGSIPAGYHQIVWDGRTNRGTDAPSGVYLARMIAPGYAHQVKMLLLR